MENFDINHNNEFVQDTEGSINIDGMLSEDEKRELSEALEWEKDEIYETTDKKLAEFLHGDVLPHLETSDLSEEVKNDLRALSQKHTLETTQESLNTELLDFFSISPEIAQAAQESLSPYGMQFSDKLESYRDYIETQLQLPAGSTLSHWDHAAIIASISQAIWENISSIPALVSDERAYYDSLNNQEVIGIINDAIEGGFAETKDTLLPNAKLFLASTAPWFYENSEDIFFSRWLESEQRYDRLELRAQRAQEAFRSEVNELWEALIAGNIDDMPDVYNGWWDIGEQFEESIWLQDGLQEISQSNFLSPEDAQRYKSAKIRATIFMMLQMLPLGITDLVWIGIDIFDTFSSTDQSFEALKNLDLIDADIHVWKAGWERAFSAIGALWGAISLDVATKWARIMRITRSAGISTADMLWEVWSFSRDLWLPDEAANAIRRSISWFWSNRANERFMNVARTNGRLSDVAWTDSYEIAGEILSVSSRERAFLERLDTAYESREIPFSITELSADQIRHLLDTLGRMHEIHGSVEVWAHSFSQIKDKLAIAMEAGIPTYIAKLAIFEGFAGVSSMKNTLEINSHTFKMILEKDESLIALLESIATEWGDIAAAVSRVDFDSEYAKFLADNSLGWLLEEEHIERILGFLEASNVEAPASFVNMIRENGGYLPTGEEEMAELFAALRLTQNTGASDEVIETTQAVETVNDVADAVTESADVFSEIQNSHPEVVDFFDSIFNESRDIISLPRGIDFASYSVHDAVDFMIENGNGIISQEKLWQLARQLKSTPEDIMSDLDFIDGEAGITDDFLRTIFRKYEENSTRTTLSDNPFEMSIFHLERRIQHTLWEQATDAVAYLRARPWLQWVIATLENADYHDLDFLRNELVEIADFYEHFWEDTTRRLIVEVFNAPDTDFSKLFANIRRYDEALTLAERSNVTRITRILEGVWMQRISPKMIERFQAIEGFKNSDWFDGTSESMAHFIGRELGPSSLYLELWQENFVALLQEWLDFNIPVDELADFMKTIEWHSSYNVARLASDARIAEIKRIREGLSGSIKTAGWKSLWKTAFLEALESNSTDAFRYISSVDTGVLRGANEILIINGETVSKIPKNKITPELEQMLANGSIDTLQDHGLDDNNIMLTMITFLQNA